MPAPPSPPLTAAGTGSGTGAGGVWHRADTNRRSSTSESWEQRPSRGGPPPPPGTAAPAERPGAAAGTGPRAGAGATPGREPRLVPARGELGTSPGDESGERVAKPKRTKPGTWRDRTIRREKAAAPGAAPCGSSQLLAAGPVRRLLLLHLQPAAAALVQPRQLEVPVGRASLSAAPGPPQRPPPSPAGGAPVLTAGPVWVRGGRRRRRAGRG